MGDSREPAGDDGPDGRARILLIIYGAELGRRYDLTDSDMTIGRSRDCDIVIDQAGVSRKHATLISDQKGMRLRDEDSRNGTFVDNRPVREAPLADGDQFRIGGTIFKFLEGDRVELDYNAELFRLSSVDGLTQLFNKRSFERRAKSELESAVTSGRPVSLIVLDVEGMTVLNETYGSVVGDQVLRELARRVRTTVRPADVVGRLTGDTFAVLAPGVTRSEIRNAMDELHHWVANDPVDIRGNQIRVEVSVGSATLGPTTRSYELLLEAAQRELNEARRARITSTLETKP